MPHVSSHTDISYSPERNCYILRVITDETNRLIVELTFTTLEYIHFLRAGIDEYEESTGSPFPFRSCYEHYSPQEEI